MELLLQGSPLARPVYLKEPWTGRICQLGGPPLGGAPRCDLRSLLGSGSCARKKKSQFHFAPNCEHS